MAHPGRRQRHTPNPPHLLLGAITSGLALEVATGLVLPMVVGTGTEVAKVLPSVKTVHLRVPVVRLAQRGGPTLLAVTVAPMEVMAVTVAVTGALTLA